ncbi:MAG: T9SS type A sorting domain-containing protein [Bacteroidota bacterium]
MHKNRFHEKWVGLCLALLFYYVPLVAQCPDTKSAAYGMVEQGLPNREKLQPTDFLYNLADTALYAELTISKDKFLCVDVGIQDVLLSGVTIEGDSFTCQEYVWVYDSVFLCSNTIRTPMAIAGKITTETNVAVPNIAVGLSSGSANYFQGTSDLGTFFFEDFETLDYQLTPSNPFDKNVRNGISTFDVLLLQKHILGIRLLDSPYKILAADLNSSGDITAYDMLLLRQMILSIIDEFPETPSWRFIDAEYEFENPRDPFAENPPTSIDLDMNALGPQLDIRFVAIKMGDMNNTVDLDSRAVKAADDRQGVAFFYVDNQLLEENTIAEIPFNITQETTIEGGQVALNVAKDDLELLDIVATNIDLQPIFEIVNGVAIISWTNPEGIRLKKGEALFELRLQAKRTINLSNSLQLTHKYVAPEIYTPTAILPFEIDWTDNSEVSNFEVFNNYPNPFSNQTTIPFYLPNNEVVTLTIFNTKGQIISRKERVFAIGNNQFDITEKLPESGLYIYQLSTSSAIAKGKMNYIAY